MRGYVARKNVSKVTRSAIRSFSMRRGSLNRGSMRRGSVSWGPVGRGSIGRGAGGAKTDGAGDDGLKDRSAALFMARVLDSHVLELVERDTSDPTWLPVPGITGRECGGPFVFEPSVAPNDLVAAHGAGKPTLVCGLIQETTRHAPIRFHSLETIPESVASRGLRQ